MDEFSPFYVIPGVFKGIFDISIYGIVGFMNNI